LDNTGDFFMKEYNLALMIQGHEIWMEKTGEEEKTVQLSLLYGHQMRIDGMADKNRFLSSYFSPDGTRGELELVTDKDRHYLNLNLTTDGYYTAYADMGVVIYSKNQDGYNQGPKFQFKDVTYAGAFHQMAKIIVPVGNASEYQAKPLHGILEIVPGNVDCTVGSEIGLTVYYEDKPLSGIDIKAISGKEGKEMACIQTDGNGTVKIPLTVEGKWMFLARHADPTKKVSEEFDESVFISTLVLEAR
jgi:uncharacterized GH25 family protein